MARNHTDKGVRVSWKIVPAVTEVWYPHPAHSLRLRTGHAFPDPQWAQRKPVGQRSRAKYARHASSVVKFASNSVRLRGYSSTIPTHYILGLPESSGYPLKSINTMNFNRAALRPLSRGPQPECGERTNSLGIKILPITPFRSRFWREFPAKILIPIDRGGEGGGGYPKAGRKQENPRNTRSAHNSLRNKDFTSNPFKLKDLA